jgi:hypothetical protein
LLKSNHRGNDRSCLPTIHYVYVRNRGVLPFGDDLEQILIDKCSRMAGTCG